MIRRRVRFHHTARLPINRKPVEKNRVPIVVDRSPRRNRGLYQTRRGNVKICDASVNIRVSARKGIKDIMRYFVDGFRYLLPVPRTARSACQNINMYIWSVTQNTYCGLLKLAAQERGLSLKKDVRIFKKGDHRYHHQTALGLFYAGRERKHFLIQIVKKQQKRQYIWMHSLLST